MVYQIRSITNSLLSPHTPTGLHLPTKSQFYVSVS
nr:MAG TPA: hypothetical protein [Caudoviricetes sp.]